jgi:hypothetical protein
MRIVVHVGAQTHEVHYGRRPTRDASLRAMYDDLASRMMLALRYTMQQATSDHRGYGGLQHVSAWLEEAQYISPAAWAILQEAKTRDDVQGHAFHGNQHTGGINGPHKPKHAHIHEVQMGMAHGDIKGAKQAVHKLLSSGHPWTKEELALAVGMDPKGKTINDYLTNLKNPKFAGPQGALKIEKNTEGHFYVALPDGQPAPPPDTKWTAAKIDAHEDMNDLTEYMHKVPDVPNNPDGTINWGAQFEALKTPDVPAHKPSPPPMESHLDLMKAAHPGSLPKAEADKLYQAHLTAAYNQLEADVATEQKEMNDALLEFKTAKATGMAAWATAVHGHPFVVKPQEVFKADHQLYKDIYKSELQAPQPVPMNVILEQWKKNTEAEKKGKFPPKAENVTMTPVKPAGSMGVKLAKDPFAASKHEPIATMSEAAPVTPIDYHTLRPKGFVDIDHDDIMSGKFRKGILSLKAELKKDGYDSSGNKTKVENALRERLKDKPNFQALVKRLGLAKTGLGSLESKLIGSWASSSGDTRPLSVALQMAVKDAFNMPDSYIEKAPLHSLQQHSGDIDALTASGIHNLNLNMKKLEPHEVKTARAALQEFVQAQYENTQDYLKSKGRDHVYVVRGMDFDVTHQYEAPSAVKLQPASSFSANYKTSAHGFSSSHSSVLVMKVPREQVLGTYQTGFGCTGEHELVVLAHKDHKAWTLPGGHHAGNATEAQEYLQHKMKQVHPELKVGKNDTTVNEDAYDY